MSQRQLAGWPAQDHSIATLGMPSEAPALQPGAGCSFPSTGRPCDPDQPPNRNRDNEHPGALSVHKDGSFSLLKGIQKGLLLPTRPEYQL